MRTETSRENYTMFPSRRFCVVNITALDVQKLFNGNTLHVFHCNFILHLHLLVQAERSDKNAPTVEFLYPRSESFILKLYDNRIAVMQRKH